MTAAVASSADFGAGAVPDGLMQQADVGAGAQQTFQQLVLKCNKDGMDFLRRGQFKQAFEQLKYAEQVLVAQQGEDEPTNLLAVTSNNLGCYYKKVGKLHAALSYLRKALKIEVSLQTDDVTVAGTHLNICAILSKLEKHDKAVQHALCALELISSRVSSGSSVTQDEYSVLAIAYHNVAVERDYMHQWDQAAAAYRQGYEIAKKCLGEQHPLTQTLGQNSAAAAQKSQPPTSVGSPTVAGRRGVTVSKAAGVAPPTEGVSAGASTPRLPDIRGASAGPGAAGRHQRGATGGSVEPMVPAPPNVVRQEASDWMQSEDVSGTWARSQPSHFQQDPQPPAPIPRSLSGGSAPAVAAPPISVPTTPLAAAGFAPAESFEPPGFSSGAGLAQADTRSNPWMQPSYLDSFAQEAQSLPMSSSVAAPPLPAMGSRPSSPPPLVIMSAPGQDRRPARERDIRGLMPREETQEPAPLLETAVDTRRRPASDSGRPPRPARARARAADRDQEAVIANTSATGPVRSGRNDALGGGSKHSQLIRKVAAEKIQQAWRAHDSKKHQSSRRAAQEQSAATKIQARFRAFIIRRKRLNKVCTIIQKWVRGWLVRLVIRRHKAAVTIQRHTTGMTVRRQITQQKVAAVSIQKKVRGAQARNQVKHRQDEVEEAALTLQRGARMYEGKRAARERRNAKVMQETQEDAANKIQSVFRGNKGRDEAARSRDDFMRTVERIKAATRLQAWARQRQAKTRVEGMRVARMDNLNKAATIIRKHWLRCLYRRRYLELRKDHRAHEKSIVVIQRYARGYLVRLRMWRDAIRAEEELWAAVEIQRCWRGYLGRLKWELEYEAVYSRLEAANRLQRQIRGWLARTRVHRMRKRVARAEFEKARRRFKAAQKVQGLVRGFQARKRVMQFRQRKIWAVLTIQKVHRGHQLRSKLWEDVQQRRAAQIQASARGFIIRNRRFHLIAKVIMIQRCYRHWLKYVPEERRQKKVEDRRSARVRA